MADQIKAEYYPLIVSAECSDPHHFHKVRRAKCSGCYCKCHGLADPIGTGFLPSERNMYVR